MTPGPSHRRVREIVVSLAVAAAAVAIIALTASPQGLAVASSPLGGALPAAASAPVASQVVDDRMRPSTAFALPVRRYEITARFGERGAHWHLRHSGLDFKAPWGTKVYAVADGTVVKLARHPAYGLMVILQVEPGVTVWYCHLSHISVKRGKVVAGQLLGRVGTTGNSTGAHLHLEVRVWDRPTDPWTYLFGPTPGRHGAVPRWYPSTPNPTVASLPSIRR